MTVPLRVLAIGSCRVFRPLRSAHEAGVVDLVNYSDRWWFTHSAAEARQYVEALTGKTHLPAEVRPFICETSLDLPDDLSSVALADVDAVCVEVSTLKAVTLETFRLNYHLVWGYAERAGVDSRAALQGLPVSWPRDDEPLRQMVVGHSAGGAVQADVLEIQKALGAPVLLVDHLHARSPSGDLAPERQSITEALSDLMLPLYSTRTLIEQHGQDVALKDHNHWASSFEPTVGDDLVRHLRGMVDNASPGPPPAPRQRRRFLSRRP